jgi:hypothetical protein
MSIRMRCQRCGRSSYSASAAAIVARGDRCPACGGPLGLECPTCGGALHVPAQAGRGATEGPRREGMVGRAPRK